MKKILIALSFAVFASNSFAQSAEWQSLFNGKNLNGWKKVAKNGDATYKVEDGAIVGISQTGMGNSFLATTKHYGDFILEFDFKIEDGLNSGVQFRSESLKDYQNYRVHGYQFEIDPAPRAWTGGIYDEARRGWLYPLKLNPNAQKAFVNNQWNKGRIEAIGNNIRTWVNGVPCADVFDNETAQGFIALQVHGISDKTLEGKKIYWKNIRICTKNLDAVKTPEITTTPQVNLVANFISPKEANDGWRLLWDGKTTEGWRGAKLTTFPQSGWNIKDGILTVQKNDGAESTNGGDIVTIKKYKNFILKVDFKITKGANSGIKYFVDTELNKGAGSSIGCEFQILDDENHPDAKLGVDGNRKLGSLYDLIPAPGDKPFMKDRFNTAMIIVKGNHVEHWLNDVKIIEYDRNNQMWNALVAYSKYKDWSNFGNMETGHILLQDHGDEVLFRSVKIKELP